MRTLAALIGTAGVGVWAFGIVAWISGVWVTMPPDEVKVLVLTAAALSGAALLLTGAVIGRTATRIENRKLGKNQLQREIPNSPFTGRDPAASRSDDANKIAR